MPERISLKQRRAAVTDLGMIEYLPALEIQRRVLDARIQNPDMPDQILLVEHPPVFTLGKNGGIEHLCVSETFLKSKGIQTIATTRGGSITYHGPGQIVLYLIFDLNHPRIGVSELVHGLEAVMMQTALDFGVHTCRSPQNPGIWAGSSKIGSIGLSIKKGVTFHGMALNVDLDLTPFSWITPCGLTGVSMTSLKQEINRCTGSQHQQTSISMESITLQLINHFSQIFKCEIQTDDI